jgi:hypothetical protein
MVTRDGAAIDEPETGISTWILEKDLVYGDTSVAAHFELDPIYPGIIYPLDLL